MAKSGLAAGLAWWIAQVVTDLPAPVLAPLTAVVVVQVSVGAAGVRTALQRSAAVVLGVVVALALGDALGLNGITVAVLVAVSLGAFGAVAAAPTLRAARQVPISVLVVLTAAGTESRRALAGREAPGHRPRGCGRSRRLVGDAGVAVVDARQTLDGLARSLGGVLETMGSALQQPWSTEQTEDWRRTARTRATASCGRPSRRLATAVRLRARNIRDRRHVEELGHYEEVLPLLERTAIGVSVISRGLDDHARLAGTTHRAMPDMGALLLALAGAVRRIGAGRTRSVRR